MVIVTCQANKLVGVVNNGLWQLSTIGPCYFNVFQLDFANGFAISIFRFSAVKHNGFFVCAVQQVRYVGCTVFVRYPDLSLFVGTIIVTYLVVFVVFDLNKIAVAVNMGARAFSERTFVTCFCSCSIVCKSVGFFFGCIYMVTLITHWRVGTISVVEIPAIVVGVGFFCGCVYISTIIALW